MSARTVSKRTRVTLAHPVVMNGTVYRTLSVRSAKPKDSDALRPGLKLAIGIGITARLCRVPEAVILALHGDDAARVGAVVDARISRICV